jgi:opacity protein-like surface antigen
MQRLIPFTCLIPVFVLLFIYFLNTIILASMKKISIALFLFAAFISTTHKISAQAVEKGDVLVDAYIGGPNLLSIGLKAIANSAEVKANFGNVSSLSANGVIPFGVKGEYMLSNHFGLGLDLNYANTGLKIAGTDSTNTAYDLAFKIPRTRALVTGNLHFGKGEKVDWYGTLGLGVGFWSPKISGTYNTNDPSLNDAINQLEKGVRNTGAAFAYRLGFGTHIYFTKNIGLNLEIGSGGPMLKAGIAVKI